MGHLQNIHSPALGLSTPFNIRQLPDSSLLAVSASGDHAFLTVDELDLLQREPSALPLKRQAELRARFFLVSAENNVGTQRLLKSRRVAKRETLLNEPSLYILVLTLQCAHSCLYCQVSRSLRDDGHAMSIPDINAACDAIFDSPSKVLTIEFQGGDPLLRFDLLEHAIRRISQRNQSEGRNLRFVIASTLHQLTTEMCAFLKEHNVYLSTSLDGPSWLHNKNRPIASKDSYERTLTGIALARQLLGHDSVSALITITKSSLAYPEEIVDEYVQLGFSDIFLRPLSTYGFAKRNQSRLEYTVSEFAEFYLRSLERIIFWNRQGVTVREVYASIVLNKMLSTFDDGYVDLQSPTAAGTSVLVYNYDGYVYPSDEARMLTETGDTSFRLGRIGVPLGNLQNSPVQHLLIESSLTEKIPGCDKCTYNQFCAPNPVDAHAQYGTMLAPAHSTEHCRRHMWMFDTLFVKYRLADSDLLDIFYRWARPRSVGHA